tara:strand:- start:449 stop:625 length:177 start_codon:yes stop_codon:yes gene_type:complete
MAKGYSKQTSFNRYKKEIESLGVYFEPSEESVQFVLNYSKSLSVKTSEKVGTLFLSLN